MPDKFVLIHGADVFTADETKHDAITAGYVTFGNVPFLVKQVVPMEIP